MFEFKLPDLGEGIHEGEILKWAVSAGETVKEDQPLVEVETDKAAVTIPSPVAGKIVSLMGNPGDIINTGNVLVVIDDGSGRTDAKQAELSKEEERVKVATPPTTNLDPKTKRPIPAAPATRRLARELGVDLYLVTPSGPGGRVTSEDVKTYSDSKKARGSKPKEPLCQKQVSSNLVDTCTVIPYLELEPFPDFTQWGEIEIESLRSIRRKTAHRMVTTKTVVPHVAHLDEADVTELDHFLKAKKAKVGGEGKMTLLSFVIKAVVMCLKKYPIFNSSLDFYKDEIVYKKYFNIGFATDTEKGLMVPVVKDANHKSINDISAEVGKLAKASRDGTVALSDLKGGTFTITNIGALGGTGLIPAINYPEVAILGMGRAQEKPVVRNGEIVIRKILPLSLAFDHRIADGADAARFVNYLIHLISDPKTFLTEI